MRHIWTLNRQIAEPPPTQRTQDVHIMVKSNSFVVKYSSCISRFHNTSSLTTISSYFFCFYKAGSWYSSDLNDLDDMLTKFLADAEDDNDTTSASINSPKSALGSASSIPNACIAPHAGYRYSGPTAAYSYLALREALVKNSSLKTIVVVRVCVALSNQANSQTCDGTHTFLQSNNSSIHHIMYIWMDVQFREHQ